MKERPIPFNTPMVRAIIGGRKTQTRRAVNPQPACRLFFDALHQEWSGFDSVFGEAKGIRCPYGQPGDKLWLREAWRTWASIDDFPPRSMAPNGPAIHYDADGRAPEIMGKYRPPMFMPRWASRILLEVTGVRIERLNDISEEDARAEGIIDGGCLNCGNNEPCGCADPKPDARDSFVRLWESINGDGSWHANPWVWVVEFRRL